MENFSEFDLKGTAPQRNFSDIIGHAFNNYMKIIGWSILVTLLTFVVSILISSLTGPLVGYNALESQAEMEELMKDGSFADGSFVTRMFQIPGYLESMLLSGVLGLLMYPVYAGYVYAMHRANTGQTVSLSDFFIGFRQNALQYIVYGLILGIAVMIGFMLCVLPVFFIIPFFFLGIPFILFENASGIDALKKSFSTGGSNYGTMLAVSFISIIITIAGIILCGIGILLTAPFFYAAMYSAYCAYIGVPREIQNPSH